MQEALTLREASRTLQRESTAILRGPHKQHMPKASFYGGLKIYTCHTYSEHQMILASLTRPVSGRPGNLSERKKGGEEKASQSMRGSPARGAAGTRPGRVQRAQWLLAQRRHQGQCMHTLSKVCHGRGGEGFAGLLLQPPLCTKQRASMPRGRLHRGPLACGTTREKGSGLCLLVGLPGCASCGSQGAGAGRCLVGPSRAALRRVCLELPAMRGAPMSRGFFPNTHGEGGAAEVCCSLGGLPPGLLQVLLRQGEAEAGAA